MGAGVGIGALIGLQRGFTLRAQRNGVRVAGVRTFTLLGLGGCLTGIIAADQPIVAAVLLAGAIALLALAYAAAFRRDQDATSPVAAIVTLAASFLAGTGSVALATACAAVATLVLSFKSDLHRFVDRLDDADMRALAWFGVIAFTVRPFLPDRSMGPYGAWNPAQLWLVVMIVTGFSFAGYIANRVFGSQRGTIVTAVIGGAYSSTAVTQALAQRLGTEQGSRTEPAGIALASAVMYVRVILLVAVLAPRMLAPFALVIAAPLIVAWMVGIWSFVGQKTHRARLRPVIRLP